MKKGFARTKGAVNNTMVSASTKLGLGGFRFGGGVDEHIHEASQKYGMPEDVLRGFVKMEDGWTGKMSPTGAIGTGQFTKGTWNGLAKKPEGRAIGMTMIDSSNFRKSNDPRYNKRVNTLATALLAKENADALKRNGLPVTGENLYMMHNIGPGVIPVLKGQGASSATLLAMRQNGMKSGMSASDFVKYQKGRFNTQYNIANKGGSFSSQNIAEGTGQVPFITPPVGAKAHHALKNGGGSTHNTINSSTVIHKVNIVADKAEQAGKAFLQEMQKVRELKNPWWKAAQYNNTAMQ